jgi:hypothetical protein
MGTDAPADVILLNGRIHTQDSSRSIAEALAIRGNTILAVGSNQLVSSLKGPKTQVIDLAGRLVLPGMIDAHTHPVESAQDLGKCSLDDKLLTSAEIKSKVRVCLRENPGDSALWFEVVQVTPPDLSLPARTSNRCYATGRCC